MIEEFDEVVQSRNVDRPFWHESYVPDHPDEVRPVSKIKRVSQSIGRIMSRITLPVINRVETDLEFLDKLPSRDSTPDQVRVFEQRFLQGHDSTIE